VELLEGVDGILTVEDRVHHLCIGKGKPPQLKKVDISGSKVPTRFFLFSGTLNRYTITKKHIINPKHNQPKR